jgi:hypothetical protein
VAGAPIEAVTSFEAVRGMPKEMISRFFCTGAQPQGRDVLLAQGTLLFSQNIIKGRNLQQLGQKVYFLTNYYM